MLLNNFVSCRDNDAIIPPAGAAEIDRPVADTSQRIETPPLPETGQPKVQLASVKDPNTNLTRTQQALLSPTEQIIASRRTT